MQTWAKRGFRTALVTGGLLMLGTGIASADEDVNPDAPPSPIDGSVSVPVHFDQNAVGSPAGTHTIPTVNNDATIRTADVAMPTRGLTPVVDPVIAEGERTALDMAVPATDKARDEASSMTSGARDQAAPMLDRTKSVTDRAGRLPSGDKLGNLPTLDDKVRIPAIDARQRPAGSANQVNADVVAPVDVSGNAVAALGHAETTNDSTQSWGTHHDAMAMGRGGVVTGNVVDADWALPVQVTNNAAAAGGTASASGTAAQEASSTGDIAANGSHSVLGGNVVAPQGATPVQANGNAVSGVGVADADGQSNASADSGGYVLTSGADSLGGGNVAPVPVAVPVKANGNAIMGDGSASATAYSTADAHSGATRTGTYGVPTYAETDGAPSVLAGNVAQPAASGPVSLCGNAGGTVGVVDATCDTASETAAGGTDRSTGAGSVGSGSIAAAPVALPPSAFGNAPVVLGTATADAANTNNATAGGDSYTRGHDSIVSGTTANTAPAGPVDLFSNPIAAVGRASTTAENTTGTWSGGNTGTTGDNSFAGGNQGTVPAAVPGEVYGNMAAGLGGADSTVKEYKTVRPGGLANTRDDNGLAASNLFTAPVATAAQVFGNSAGAAAATNSTGDANADVTSGGPSMATGAAGFGSGNIAQAPVSQPFQFFGNGVSGLARGTQFADNDLTSTSGGDATSTGADSAAGGNVASVPLGGAGQMYGETVAALGRNDTAAGSATASQAGGDTETSGENGLGSGNVASPQAMPVAQGFAAAAAGVNGRNSTAAVNETGAQSGGDIRTTGASGVLSGNLADVPAGAFAQPFSDAVSAVGSSAHSAGVSDTEGKVGGTSTTSGSGLGSLSGMDATVPVGATAPVYDVPAEVLARATTQSTHTSAMQVGEQEPQFNFPVRGGLSATEIPTLVRGARSMVDDPARGVFHGLLSTPAVLAPPPILPTPPKFITPVPVRRDLPGRPVRMDLGRPLESVLPTGLGSFGGNNVVPAPVLARALAESSGTSAMRAEDDRSPLDLPVSGGLAPTELPTLLPRARSMPNTPAQGTFSGALGGFTGDGPIRVTKDSPVNDVLGGHGVPANLFGGVPTQRAMPRTADLGDLTDATTIIPVVPVGAARSLPTGAGDVPELPAGAADVTTLLPVVQALPVGPKLPVHAPSVGSVSPRMDASTLDSTRAALANLFTTHPIG